LKYDLETLATVWSIRLLVKHSNRCVQHFIIFLVKERILICTCGRVSWQSATTSFRTTHAIDCATINLCSPILFVTRRNGTAFAWPRTCRFATIKVCCRLAFHHPNTVGFRYWNSWSRRRRRRRHRCKCGGW
jgi:hypothetical protein